MSEIQEDKLRLLEARAEGQLCALEQDFDMFPTRDYIAALRLKAIELEVYKSTVQPLVNHILTELGSVGARRPLTSKLVETRGNGIAEGRSTGGNYFTLRDVKDLNYPGALTGPKAAEIQIETEGSVDGQAVQTKDVVSGDGVD